MPQRIALACTEDVDWTAPEQADETADCGAFGQSHAASIRGGYTIGADTARGDRGGVQRPTYVLTGTAGYRRPSAQTW